MIVNGTYDSSTNILGFETKDNTLDTFGVFMSPNKATAGKEVNQRSYEINIKFVRPDLYNCSKSCKPTF